MFDIVYSHPDFHVINKHPNVSVHKDAEETPLLAQVSAQTGDASLYLIHRLDKMTSGLLLLGRNAAAARELSGLFARREVNKYYLAVLTKKPNKKQGCISGDMEKSRRGSWKLTTKKDNPAITQFFTYRSVDGVRLALCKPVSGKTHQIRVAMKSIASPIAGDVRYGAPSADRGYLHAYALNFCYQQQMFDFLLPPEKGACWPEIPAQWQQPALLPWPVLKGHNLTKE